MQYRIMLVFVIGWIVMLKLVTGCKCKEKRSPSANYQDIRPFLAAANIDDPSLLFFYTTKSRWPLPNVYLFDKDGKPVRPPSECYQGLAADIAAVEKQAPPRIAGKGLEAFLNEMPVVDAYGTRIRPADLGSYDYYLLVDFLAIPDKYSQQALTAIVQSVKRSSKHIRLLLIHALSRENSREFIMPGRDTVFRGSRQAGLPESKGP